MRQWVESEPCGQLELCLGAFPLPPVSTLVPLSLAPSLQTELRLDSITVTCKAAPMQVGREQHVVGWVLSLFVAAASVWGFG